MSRPPTPEEVDRALDKAAAVVDGEGRLLGYRDLTPQEARAPAVTIAVLGLDLESLAATHFWRFDCSD